MNRFSQMKKRSRGKSLREITGSMLYTVTGYGLLLLDMKLKVGSCENEAHEEGEDQVIRSRIYHVNMTISFHKPNFLNQVI